MAAKGPLEGLSCPGLSGDGAFATLEHSLFRFRGNFLVKSFVELPYP